MTIERARQLYFKGSFSKAQKLIKKVIDKNENNSKKQLSAKLLLGEILFKDEKFDSSKKIVKELIDLSNELNYYILKISALILLTEINHTLANIDKSFELLIQIDELISQLDNENTLKLSLNKVKHLQNKGNYLLSIGYYDEAFKQYQNSWSIIKDINNEYEKSNILHHIGNYYAFKRDYDQAINYFQKSLSLREKSKNKYLIAESFNDIGSLVQGNGDLEESIGYFNNAMKIFFSIGLQGKIASVYNNLGTTYQLKGELNLAFENYNTALNISNEIGLKSIVALSYSNIAIILHLKGEYDNALENHYHSMNINENIKDKLKIAGNYNNIGVLYQIKGELDDALIFHEKHLDIVHKLQNKYEMAMAYVNLGTVYHRRGEFEKAKEYFSMCLLIDKAIGNDIEIAETTYHLVRVHLEQDEKGKALKFLDELEILEINSPHKIIKLRFQLASALFYKSSTRTINRAKSQEILMKISLEEVIDYEITVFAKLNLCELLLIELKSTGDEEVLDEFKELVENLHHFAQDQNSWLLLAEIYLLQSKLALLELDLDQTQKLIGKAQIIADSKGLTNLGIKISNHFDDLSEQQNTIKRLISNKASLSERLAEIDLEDQLIRMINRKPENISEIQEKPAMLMILDESGISLYNKRFHSLSKLKEDLIGGLLTAIHTLSEDIFSASGSVQRIKHNEYTIVLKPFQSLLFCYAFTGQSYTALQRLDNLIDVLNKSKTIWDALSREIPGLTASEKIGMELVTDEIFGNL